MNNEIIQSSSGIDWTGSADGIGLILAMLAMTIAFFGVAWQIYHSRDVAKKNKAINVLLEAEKDAMHENGLAVLRKYKKNGKGILIANLAESNLHADEIHSLKSENNILKNVIAIDPDVESTIKQNKIRIKRLKSERKERFKDRDELLYLLNYYEYIAIAIKKNIICDDLLFNANHSSFCWIYESSKPLINKYQTDQETVFSEMTNLYKVWSKRRKELIDK